LFRNYAISATKSQAKKFHIPVRNLKHCPRSVERKPLAGDRQSSTAGITKPVRRSRSSKSGGSALQSPLALGLRAAGFLVVFAFLQLGWQALRGSAIERAVIHDGIVRPAALLVNLLTPATRASAVDFTLHAPGGGLNIQNGCEGLEALFLLSAAFSVAPISWRSRGGGLLLGCAVVFLINQARILVLFYAYRADHSLFDPLHAMVTPIVVILLVCAYFYAWLLYSDRRVAAAA
jgi:exosortase/archaeosortase family protein